MGSLQFNNLLLEISNTLSSDQLEQMKFLLHGEIGKKHLENVKSGTQLFELLKERNKLAADNTDFLSDLLKKIRPDLVEKIDNFIIQPDPSYGLNEAQEEKLNIATDVIAENLGKNWRRLGRKLHFTDVKLDSISNRHPTDLQETAVELLKEWRKAQKAEAQIETLIDALRACQMNLTADKVEKKISELPA